MTALLRFQGVVLTRTFANPIRLLLLLAAPLCVVLAANEPGIGRIAYVIAAFGIVFTFAGWGMTNTYDVLHTVRWSGPLASGRLFRAHMVFWTALCAAALTPVAALAGDETGFVFVDAVILSVALALVMPFVQRFRRGGASAGSKFLAVFACFMLSPAVMSLAMAWSGHPFWALWSGVVLCVLATLGVTTLRRDERLPVASGGTDVRETPPPRRKPRSASAAMRASTSPGFAWFWVLFAFGMQFAFWTRDWFPLPAMYVFLGIPQLSNSALSACHWLFATPMDRGRMFRRLFGPIPLVMFACVGARLLMSESLPDRTAFFRSYQGDRLGPHRADAVALGELWEIDEARHAYRTPDIAIMATRLSDRLRRLYGAEISAERIDESIRRGWPSPGPAVSGEWSYEWQQTFFGAMDRLQAELADELVAADRLRNTLIAGVVALIGLASITIPSPGGLRRLGGTVVLLFVVVLFYLPLLAPNAAISRDVQSWCDAVLVAFQHSSVPMRSLWFVGWAVVAFALWKRAERRFRRIDVTDIGPSPWGALRRARN